MKSSLKLSTAVLFLSFLLINCSKNKGSFESYLKGTLDGVAFECTSNIKAYKPEQLPGSGSDPKLTIIGNWGDKSIQLFITDYLKSVRTGQYVFNSSNVSYVASAELSIGFDNFGAGNNCTNCVPNPIWGSGSISILEISEKYVKGTFGFVTEPDFATGIVKTITNGEFYIKRG